MLANWKVLKVVSVPSVQKIIPFISAVLVHLFRGNQLEKDSQGKVVTRPYLIKYVPPKDLSSLE